MKGNQFRGSCLVAVWALSNLWGGAAWADDDAKVLPAVRGVGIFRLDTREETLQGETSGVAISRLGEIELAPDLNLASRLEEPFVLAAAALPGGGVLVGTGADGKILRVLADGQRQELGQVGEGQIFAVLARRDGSLLAASSPHGKVYRLREGAPPEILFDPGETYIWALAEDLEGQLLVATGGRGRLYRVSSRGQGELLHESQDPHLRSLLVEPDGSLVFGTVGQGLVQRLRFTPGTRQPQLETLYDSPLPEVLGLTRSPDGRLFAAFLASEASQVELQKNDGASGETPTAVGTRAPGATGPRSVVVSLDQRKYPKVLFELQDETIHSLLWLNQRLWIGTGQEGHLYSWHDDTLIREAHLEQRQLVALVPETSKAPGRSDGFVPFWIATSDAAAVHRVAGRRAPKGTYTSTVLDAGQVAEFGELRFEGELPTGAEILWSLRSGMSQTPDISWSAWQPVLRLRPTQPVSRLGSPEDGQRAELGPGQFVQIRAELRRGPAGQGPKIAVLELSYRQNNVAPNVEKLEVLAPGEILVPTGFNPTTTTFEPWSPNREGIFVSIRAAESEDGRLKSLYKKGFRTLRWTAQDANKDPLRFQLAVRPDGVDSDGINSDGIDADGVPEGANDEDWLVMVEELDQDFYNFDATVLPDGVYRFRLIASDHHQQAVSKALSTTRVSEKVVIDHTPPALKAPRKVGDKLELELEDAWSPLLRVELSTDGGPWRLLEPEDGLVDGRRELFRVRRPDGVRYLLLRATDAAFNVLTFPLAQP